MKRMHRMERYDKTAEDIYKLLQGREREGAMKLLADMLHIDQTIRAKLLLAKRNKKEVSHGTV